MLNAICDMEKGNIQTSKALQDLFYRYTHLLIGDKEIVCPYWMNKLKEGIYGPGGGKARPEEVVEFTKSQAEKQRVNLEKLSEAETLAFMEKNKIGVDCSGFAFWMLNELDLEKGGNGLEMTVTKMNVKMLTDNTISVSIDQVEQIKPGDMVRFRGGGHIAVILSLQEDSITYAHSSSRAYSRISGVHSGKIIVINPRLGLRQQKWQENTSNGSSYSQHLWPDKGDGVKRLKIWG